MEKLRVEKLPMVQLVFFYCFTTWRPLFCSGASAFDQAKSSFDYDQTPYPTINMATLPSTKDDVLKWEHTLTRMKCCVMAITQLHIDSFVNFWLRRYYDLIPTPIALIMSSNVSNT